METFFGDRLLISSGAAEEIYAQMKDLPIIDYHCHLDETKIAANAGFADIGELWLAGDHYKWRAMRLCGVDEEYITGKSSFHDKFVKYAEILPQLVGNPLYYWSHLELKQIFGIDEPLNAKSAERIWNRASETLKNLRVQDLFRQFRVEYVATTDDPTSDLAAHGKHGGTRVSPTFRPDKLYALDEGYLEALGKSAGAEITSLDGLLSAISKRLDYFAGKGCKISDHGFEKFPKRYADRAEAEALFARRKTLNAEEKDAFFGFLLVWLAKEYAKRNMIMQLHFSVVRNNNSQMFGRCGVDSGFDLISGEQSVKDLILFFNQVSDDERPQTVLYTLNDNNLSAIAAVTGAFRKVRMGAAWWFNDTVEGIRKNLSVVSEYSALGTSFGMLTDSRSFSSYVRFDFFRRILSDYLGNFVEKGEYPLESAVQTAKNICYYNVKEALGL